jgi:hypothetical protein
VAQEGHVVVKQGTGRYRPSETSIERENRWFSRPTPVGFRPHPCGKRGRLNDK